MGEDVERRAVVEDVSAASSAERRESWVLQNWGISILSSRVSQWRITVTVCAHIGGGDGRCEMAVTDFASLANISIDSSWY